MAPPPSATAPLPLLRRRRLPSLSRRTRRLLCFAGVAANCLTAGSIFTFPLFGPPLARGIGLTGAQTNALASASILGEYAAAVLWGHLSDLRGPGFVSLCASLLYLIGYGLLGWRYQASVALDQQGLPLPEGQWVFLCFYYFLAGCATAASYFGAIIASTKSLPGRHSGLAIGVPCAIFGLSPLFLSALAPYFTVSPSLTSPFFATTAALEGTTGLNDELDPGRWLLFLAIMLCAVNGLSGLVLGEVEWVDEEVVERDSGFVGSERSSVVVEEVDERTALLAQARRTAAGDEEGSEAAEAKEKQEEQTIGQLLSTPTFWLFGLVIFLSTGPCEMVMASLGGIVESLLGIRIASSSFPPSPSRSLPVLALSSTISHDARALALRRLHVQVLSISNTVSRLLIGLVSDWMSYASAVRPIAPREEVIGRGWKAWASRKVRERPRVSRLAFLFAACVILSAAFAFVAMGMDQTSQLWVLSIGTGLSYGLAFTIAPAIVRVVYPVSAFGRNWGLLTWFSALGALLFTPLFGVLLDAAAQRQKSTICYGRECYEVVFVLSSASCAVAACIVGVLWRGWWRGLV